ncbi:hypothetical protein HGB13_04950 [bacterium]|nr:hypothetical protein [bacterium]
MKELRDLPPIAKHHLNTTLPETVEKIKGFAMTHPSKGTKLKLIVEIIMTDNGREFCGAVQQHFDLYLELEDIKHRQTMGRHP